jgi:hypothetical protein
MDAHVDYVRHADKAQKLFDDLVLALGTQLSESDRNGLNELVGCGELDDAIESILDMSGASHLFRIPDSLAPKIKDWLSDFGEPKEDDDDYTWYAAERALAYSRLPENLDTASHTIALDLKEPDYQVVANTAASSGKSPQELIEAWVKERIREFAYA